MAKKNLNKLFDYTLIGKAPILKKAHLKILGKTPPLKGKDWQNSGYKNIKKFLRAEYVFEQIDRCAFCRNSIEPDGYWEDLEHIVAKSKRPKWMFNTQNLVVTCKPCNGLKRTENTLDRAFKNKRLFPSSSNAFVTFNPHFDLWSDHFIVDDIFLKAKTTGKGLNTIKKYKLYRYHICINISREYAASKPQNKKSVAWVAREIALATPNSPEDMHLRSAFKHFNRLLTR